MVYLELEQFLGRGDEKFFWILTFKHLVGLGICGMLGHRIGSALFHQGAGVILAMLVGGVIGIWFTSSQKGLMRVQRLFLLLRFVVRRLQGQTIVDAATLFASPVTTAPMIRVRQRDGKALVMTRTRMGRAKGRAR